MFLYLVRHGQSVWNAENRHQGWQNVPLSPLGELQAQRIAQRLSNMQFDYRYTSPILRCYDTAATIVKAQGLAPETALEVDENIKEGRISARREGRLNKELFSDWTDEEKRLFREDYSFKFEDGESVKGVIERTLAFFERVAALSEEPLPDEKEEELETRPKPTPKTALVVAHLLNIQILTLYALNSLDAIQRRQDNIDRLAIGNCSLTVIETNLKGKAPFFRVHTVSDASHLAGLKAPEPPIAQG
ncbi:MAG: histidine phosphatase family protein [Chloroflexi bacterium]|uniref:Histidine phosphatase family protein n=1 Tax=Candidatus Chlorohelix allophototropha TaxID=3003348 RepID=A0A8T7MAA8_9CHLR|nr:histidine phosphatase family protein [Chloroflexota bacterium]WJW68895.1 histidine phosphatase family protein [Chloroflexota bacterium L227-S17]